MFFTSDSSFGNISDSEIENLATLRIDDWLIFQMDREVATLLLLLLLIFMTSYYYYHV